jgi:hypothetical protein
MIFAVVEWTILTIVSLERTRPSGVKVLDKFGADGEIF